MLIQSAIEYVWANGADILEAYPADPKCEKYAVFEKEDMLGQMELPIKRATVKAGLGWIGKIHCL